jgi:hypothetical protein
MCVRITLDVQSMSYSSRAQRASNVDRSLQ